MMKDKYNYGYYNLDAKFTTNWTVSDYLINNQVLHFNKDTVVELRPFTSNKKLSVKLILYALIDLTKENKFESFTISRIMEQIEENKIKYISLIRKRAFKMAERYIPNKMRRSLSKVDENLIKEKVQSRKAYYLKILNDNYNVRKDDLYCAIYLLIPLYINCKIREMKSNNTFQDKRMQYYYSLNRNGKELIGKVIDKKYVI